MTRTHILHLLLVAVLASCSGSAPNATDKPLSIVPGTRRSFIVSQLGSPVKTRILPSGRTEDSYLTKHEVERAWPIDRTVIEYDRTGKVVRVSRIPMPPSQDVDLGSMRTVRVNPNLDADNFGLTPDDPRYQWFQSLQRKILKQWAYGRPIEKDPRDVGIRFTVASNGTLVEVELSESSGVEDLDQHVVESIREAAPFLPFPPSMQRQEVINMTFHYGVEAYLGLTR